MILLADLHLTDVAAEEYRWRVFDFLLKFMEKTGDYRVFILGDLADRKDKHSGQFVNRILENLWRILSTGATIDIIMGNHDAPMTGVPYWNSLNYISKRLSFVIRPKLTADGILLLPYTPDPHGDWRKAVTWMPRGIFMHQPVNNAVLESGLKYQNAPLMPHLPDVPIWSGDIHTPQEVGKFKYVGAPHPIKFGDAYPTRFIQLQNDTLKLYRECNVRTIARRTLNVTSAASLRTLVLRSGDQVKVRYSIQPERLHMWPAEKADIALWAKENGLVLHSIEPVVVLGDRAPNKQASITNDPNKLLADFAEREGLTEEILKTGQRILRQASRK
jgi:hypothetical protein